MWKLSQTPRSTSILGTLASVPRVSSEYRFHDCNLELKILKYFFQFCYCKSAARVTDVDILPTISKFSHCQLVTKNYISGEIKANQKQQNIFEQIKINIWGKQSILFNLSYKACQRLVVFLSSNQLMINWQHIPFPTRSWLSRRISHAVQSNTHEHYQPLPCQANYHSCRNTKTKMPARAWN